MEQKNFDHLRLGYIYHVACTDRDGKPYEKQEEVLKIDNQETRDILAAAIASNKPVYIQMRENPNPKTFPPNKFGDVRTTTGFISLSQYSFDQLKG